MVVRQEYPNIRAKSIDLDLSGDASEYESAADLVLGECLDSDASMFVAYRNAQRWVQTYEPVILETPGHGCSSFREGGVYMITGGLGKIGVAISEYLAAKYRARLVLVGRSSLPSRESWNTWIGTHPADDPVCARIGTIERLEKLGAEVLYVNASVADISAMRRVIERSYQRFGTLHGVIHGAGIVGNKGYREIKESDRDNCDGHFQAKAHGLLVLEQVLEGKALDFCLLLSSLTSVLGGIGQAAYASSNIYMDSFARRHNRTSSPMPWLSVNWDVWRSHDDAAIDSDLGTTLKELGMSAEEATERWKPLGREDRQPTCRVDGRSKYKNQSMDQTRITECPGTDASASPTRSTFSQRPVCKRTMTRRVTKPRNRLSVWRDALGIDEVGINDSFSQLGGHSLLAIRIVSELRKAFQIDLSIKALFDAPTVAELSSYIKKLLIAEIETLSDKEAQQLVSKTRV